MSQNEINASTSKQIPQSKQKKKRKQGSSLKKKTYAKISNLSQSNKPLVLSFIDNQKLSYILVLIAVVFWVVGYTFSNDQNLHPIETNFIRYLTQTVAQFIINIVTHSNMHYKNQKDFKLLIIKGIIAAAHAYMIAEGQYFLPLTVVHTINSAGIIFIFFQNYLIYKIQVTGKQILAMCVGSIGLLLTISGRITYHLMDPNYTFQSEFENYRTHDSFVILIFSLFFLAWMSIWAFSIIVTNKTNAEINQIIFIQSIVGFFIYSILYSNLDHKTNMSVFLLTTATTGISLTIANYLFTFGLSISENIGSTTMINQTSVLVSYIVSIFYYKQEINWISLAGNAFCIGSVYVITMKK